MSLPLHRRTVGDPPRLGMWVKIPSIETIEMIAHVGYDFIVVDLEHGPMTLESCYRAIVVAQGRGLAALVRMPDASGALTQRVLDMGADGLLVPHVTSPAVARTIVSAAMFPPDGGRGLGTTSRAGMWGLNSTPTYVERSRTDVLRIPQIEDPEAVESAEEICTVDGVNAILIGLGDLSLSVGLPATDPAVEAMTDRVLRAAAESGIPCGTAVRTAQAAAAAAARGFDFVVLGNDATVFGDAAQHLITSARTLIGAD